MPANYRTSFPSIIWKHACFTLPMKYYERIRWQKKCAWIITCFNAHYTAEWFVGPPPTYITLSRAGMGVATTVSTADNK